jgi:amino acid adenylation domain-containing protein
MKSLLNLPVHELFEQQSAAAPEAVALLFENQELRYAPLNERANRLAHRLIRLGIKKGTLVGLCMEHSPEVVVGLLGILKAGAAYVPFDPTYPDERLAFMLRDTAAPLILANQATKTRLAPFSRQAAILCLDAEAEALADESSNNPTRGVTGDDLAYVIYTSGSTGTPKGVLINHRGVVRLVRDTDYCRFGPGEVFLHLAPLAFDASTFEIWGPLLNGSQLAIFPQVPPTPDELAAAIRRYGVTTMWLTAALFHLVVDQRVEALGRLRQLVAGGDVLSPSHVGRALEALQDGVVINGYGPTESTTFACCYRMNKDYRPGTAIPIGRAISNTTTYVLDERLQPVPVGAAGELYIGGDGLARGYLNNAELTKEKFVSDPFSSDPSARLYRTGDRVRSLADGNLEFLGRFDNQIKIMGHRIDPGEIETTLWRHPEVRQAVVIARPQPRGDKQLVAYVVPKSLGGFSSNELKRYLADHLPPYMVPSHIVALERFPLTPNAKVDRSALPAPERPKTAAAECASLSTELQEKIMSLWGRILNCCVGPDENFFDLGGTSLQLLEVHAELTKLLGRNLPVTELFDNTTVRSLVGRLAGAESAEPALPRAHERGNRQKEAFARQRRLKGIGQ